MGSLALAGLPLTTRLPWKMMGSVWGRTNWLRGCGESPAEQYSRTGVQRHRKVQRYSITVLYERG